jgi:uncharacterized protein YbjT (DUF2867 family)
MHIILGATGHIGSALCGILLDQGEPVTVVTRSESKRAEWEKRGAKVAVVDVSDVSVLQRVFARGKRVYLLNPPADPSTDTDVEERKTVHAILAALEGAELERIVAQSTYGVQPGEAIGDLGVLYELERGLQAQAVPTAIIRGAYYMSNWDMSLDAARSDGRLDTLLPAELVLPMVAPHDIARLAATLLTSPVAQSGLYFAEGLARYSPADVAAAFAAALGREVSVSSAPPEVWTDVLKGVGFSPVAARSMANMTRTVVEDKPELPHNPVRGNTTLQAYIAALVSTV